MMIYRALSAPLLRVAYQTSDNEDPRTWWARGSIPFLSPTPGITAALLTRLSWWSSSF